MSAKVQEPGFDSGRGNPEFSYQNRAGCERAKGAVKVESGQPGRGRGNREEAAEKFVQKAEKGSIAAEKKRKRAKFVLIAGSGSGRKGRDHVTGSLVSPLNRGNFLLSTKAGKKVVLPFQTGQRKGKKYCASVFHSSAILNRPPAAAAAR